MRRCTVCDKIIYVRGSFKIKGILGIIIMGNYIEGGSGKMKLIRIILNIDNISISRDLYTTVALTATL